jgi:hypothetical protein
MMRHVLPPGREKKGGGFASGVLFLSVGVAERRPAGRSSAQRHPPANVVVYSVLLLQENIFLFSNLECRSREIHRHITPFDEKQKPYATT